MTAPLPLRLLALALATLPWLPAAQAQAPRAEASASAPGSPATRITVRKDTLWNIAGALVQGAEPTRAQVMVAILRANPEAFLAGNMHRLRQDVPLLLPSLAAMQAESPAEAAALVASHQAAVDEGQAVPALPALSGSARTVPAPAPATPAVAGTAASAVAAPVTPAPASAVPRGPVFPAADGASAAASAPPAASVPASVPASSPVKTPAVVAAAPSSAASAGSAASARADAPAAAPAPGPATHETPLGRWFPYAMLLVLTGGATVLWLRRRPAVAQAEAPTSTFVDEEGVQRRRRPKVLDVSQAAAEMVRTVETLQPTLQLVRSASETAAAGDGADLHRQAALRLDLARACIEVGRGEAARAVLSAVLREGSPEQQADATVLMGRLG